MFFFIGGVQPKTVLVDERPRICPSCGRTKGFLKRTDSYLSLFFVPLFRLRRGVAFLICEHCGFRWQEGQAQEGPPPGGNRLACCRCGRKTAPDHIYCPYCGKTL